MNINAFNSVMPARECQPLKGSGYKGALVSNHGLKNAALGAQSDYFAHSNADVQEQKFDMACRLAAYYRTQYENLMMRTGCCV